MPLNNTEFEKILNNFKINKKREDINVANLDLSESQLLSILETIKNNNIVKINFQGCQVTDKVVTEICKIQSLTTLDISKPTGKYITHHGASILATHKNLISLNLEGHDSLTGTNGYRTVEYFLRNNNLIYLKINHLPIQLDKKLQNKVAHNKNSPLCSFLMGTHKRLGADSAIKKYYYDQPNFEKKTLSLIFDTLYGENYTPTPKVKKAII